MREIHYYSKNVGHVFSRLGFSRIVREIAGNINEDIRFQATALAALQEIAESQLVMWFEMGYKCMIIVDLI